MFGWGKRKKRRGGGGSVSESLEGVAEVGAGCAGCDINLMIALVVFAGVPLLLWSS